MASDSTAGVNSQVGINIEEYCQLAIKIINQEGEDEFQGKIEKNHGHPVLKPIFKNLFHV